MQAAPVTGMIASVDVGRGACVLVAVGKEVLVGSSVGLEAACVPRFIASAVWKAEVAIALVSRVGAGRDPEQPESMESRTIPAHTDAAIRPAIKRPLGNWKKFWFDMFPDLCIYDENEFYREVYKQSTLFAISQKGT
jgi:hypothetical protein